MTVQLPIPITHNSKEYSEINIKELTAGVIAETRRVANQGDPYRAYQSFIAGCTVSIGDITDKPGIYGVLGYLPYKNAEELVRQILILDGVTDNIDGVYECPLCGDKLYCTGENSDKAKDLIVNYGSNERIILELSKPIEIATEEMETIKEVDIIALENPTLNQCSVAFGKYGNKNEAELQLAIYTEGIVAINNVEIDKKWRTRWGLFTMKNLNRVDTMKLTELMNQYGLETEKERRCKSCGQVWKAGINTANFFASALR